MWKNRASAETNRHFVPAHCSPAPLAPSPAALVPLAFLALVLFILQGCLSSAPAPFKCKSLTAPDNSQIALELAATPSELEAGLSNRASLCESCGMLFIFEKKAKHSFWMQKMNFALDIVFLDENFTVVDAKENVPPCPALENCPVISPRSPSLYVLEVNAGFSKKHGITEGAKLACAG